MRKVLVVDETVGVKSLMGPLLQRMRVELLSAGSGAEAMRVIETEKPDLVVCDVYMPDTDGYRICDFVRAHPKLKARPVLLMVDSVDRTVLARAERAGFDDVLRKPWGADELVGRIEDLLGQKGIDATPFDVPAVSADADGNQEQILPALAGMPGVTFAALADREGFLIDWAGAPDLDPEVVAAVASSLAESSEGIGRELGQGKLQSVIFQYDEAIVLVECAGSESRLAVVLRDFGALEAVRQSAKRLAVTASASPNR
jgi:CheY-like chemotaxis protein